MTQPTLPPSDWDDLLPPDDPDFSMPDDPFGDDPFLMEYLDSLPDDDPYVPFTLPDAAPVVAEATRPSPSDTDANWGWHDSALIGVTHWATETEPERFSVGVIDLYADAATGDLGGEFLEIGSFYEVHEAGYVYAELHEEMYERQILPFEMRDFAEEHAEARAMERGKPAPDWRGATAEEYRAYDETRTLFPRHTFDVPPDDLDLDAIFADDGSAIPPELDDPSTFRALREIGIAADALDPDTDPPPFIDPETGTAYWIGVFQPDADDRENCVTSILSLGRNPDTGEMEAQLAPCVPGDWDKTYEAAEFLLGVVERGGIEGAFDAAEGMALATDQRELWEAERGLPLEPNAAQELANFTRDEWEIDL